MEYTIWVIHICFQQIEEEEILSNILFIQAPVAHICNPSYSGGWDQEDPVWSQPRGIVCKTLSQKILHKKGLVEWLKV
jgi:hypothetical protein